MDVRKIIQRRIRRRGGGVDLAADVNAVIAGNVGARRTTTHVSARQSSAAAAADDRRTRGGGDGEEEA